MKVKRLFIATAFPNHMVVEKSNGTFGFFITPLRTVRESELIPLKYFRAVGRNATEAPDYMYRMYGLEKEEL